MFMHVYARIKNNKNKVWEMLIHRPFNRCVCIIARTDYTMKDYTLN